jgi:hypothetical protein
VLASEAGIAEIYGHALAAFEPLLKKRTTQSSIGFAGSLNGSSKTVISLLPGESSAADGLHYHLYKSRYAELTRLPLTEVENLMPRSRDDWVFGNDPSAGPDWEGFEGFTTSNDEIDRLAAAVREAAASRRRLHEERLSLGVAACAAVGWSRAQGRRREGRAGEERSEEAGDRA